MKTVLRKIDGYDVIYDLEYRHMTNEEIYEGQIRSDFKSRKVPIVKSIKIARIAQR